MVSLIAVLQIILVNVIKKYERGRKMFKPEKKVEEEKRCVYSVQMPKATCDRLKTIAKESNIKPAELVRQMINYCIADIDRG